MPFLKEKQLTLKEGAYSFLLPSLDEIRAIETLIEGLDWINQEFLNDCSGYKNNKEAFNDPKFIVRNTTRTLAYSNQAALLEDLIFTSYTKLVSALKVSVSKKIKRDQKKLDLQKVGFERTKVFRNKVSAHLAYAKPLDSDNLSTRLSSLLAVISPGSVGDDPKMFCLGSIQVHASNEAPSTHIPPMNIWVTHRFMTVHYEKWGIMFDEIIQKARGFQKT